MLPDPTTSGSPLSRVPAGAFPERRHFVWLGGALAVFLGVLLGARGLNEPDEGRYTNIALAYLYPGADLREPRMSGFAHYDMPPLTYWVTALCFSVFGRNEWAARMPCYFGRVKRTRFLASGSPHPSPGAERLGPFLCWRVR